MANNATADKLLKFTAEKLRTIADLATSADTTAKSAQGAVNQFDTRINQNATDISALKSSVADAVRKANQAKETADSVSATATQANSKATSALSKVDSKVDKFGGTLSSGKVNSCTLGDCSTSSLTISNIPQTSGAQIYGDGSSHLSFKVGSNIFEVGQNSARCAGIYNWTPEPIPQDGNWKAVRVSQDGSLYGHQLHPKTVQATASTMKMNDLVANQQLTEQGIATMALNEEPLPTPMLDFRNLLDLNVYQNVNEGDGQTEFGLSLEEVERVFPCACSYYTDKKGNEVPTTWENEPMILGLLMLAQEHNTRIEELETRNDELQSQLDSITTKLNTLIKK